jgi:hypothetical protein
MITQKASFINQNIKKSLPIKNARENLACFENELFYILI